MAALGTFTLVIDGIRQGGTDETAAKVYIRTQTPDGVLSDPDADRYITPHPSAKDGLSVSLPYTTTLATDVLASAAAGTESTVIGYEVRVNFGGSSGITRAIVAQRAGDTKNLADLSTQVSPVVAQTGADIIAQVQAAAAVIEREQPGGVAGLTQAGKLYEVRIPDRLSDAALASTFVPLEGPAEHAPALGLYFPEAEGALGDGATDDTAALLACRDVALPGNGTIILGLGKTYGLSAELQMLGQDRAVALVGTKSVIKALHADARVSWGQTPTGPGNTGVTVWGRPGLTHGWKFDGNLLATLGVKFGIGCSHATFENITSTRCNGDGIHVYTQNCVYISLVGEDNAGHGWVIDYGAQVSTFIGCHGLSNDGWQWQVRQSGGPGWGMSAQPQSLTFLGGIAEQGGAPSFLDTGLGGFHVREGIDITWDRFDFADQHSTDPDASPLVLTPSTANGYVNRNVVRDCRIYGDLHLKANAGGVAQGMGGTNEPLALEGWNVFAAGGRIVNGSTARIYDRAIRNTTGSGADVTYVTEGTGAFPSLSPDGAPLPRHLEVTPFVPPESSVAATVTAFPGAFHNAVVDTVAQNAHMEWDVAIPSGTYTLRVLWRRGTLMGIITPSIDGVDLATIDTYGTAQSNNVTDYAGLVVKASGHHKVRFRVATRNASSTGWTQSLHGFTLTRTGA